MPGTGSGGSEPNLELVLIDTADHIHLEPGLTGSLMAYPNDHQRSVLQLQPELTQIRPHAGAGNRASAERLERGRCTPQVVKSYVIHGQWRTRS
jgi:hypothetical protein